MSRRETLVNPGQETVHAEKIDGDRKLGKVGQAD